MVDDRLFPGHSTVSSFLKSAKSDKNVPSLNYISAKHLFSPCPPSLCTGLDTSNPHRQFWLDSYNKEKQGLINHEVYEKISKSHYLALRGSGKIPKLIPSMCVLVVKNQKIWQTTSRQVTNYSFGGFRVPPILKIPTLRSSF